MSGQADVKPVKRRVRMAQLERDLAIERERAKMLREDLRQALRELNATHAAMDITGTRPPGLADLSGKPVRPLAVNELDLADYFRQVDLNYRGYANPFHHYEQLLTMLESHTRVSLSPCYEFAGAPRGSSVQVSLRHDVDADPVTAVRMARLLARRGIGATFYLLHTAIYYGQFFGSLFIRHRELPRWIEQMLVAGCELGVHNDALGAHQRLGVDGPAALVQEIEWLRGQGATIRGTAGHNSAPVYQAENSEIFRGRVLWNTDDAVRGRLPLGVLDEGALGLTYEGTFAARRRTTSGASAFAGDRASADIRSPSWMKAYLCENPCCDWQVDMQVWVVGQNRWVAGGRVGGQVYFRDGLTLTDLRTVMDDLPGGARCLFVLHPEYFRA